MKRIFVIFLIIIIYLLASFIYVLNTPEFTQHAIRWAVKKYLPQYNVQSLNLTRQRVLLGPGLYLGEFYIVLSPRDGVNPLYINFDRISIMRSSGREFQLDLYGGEIRQGKTVLKGINLTAFIDKDLLLFGAVQIADAVHGPFEIADIVTEITANRKGLKITDIEANIYEGKVAGDILVEYDPELNYSVSVDVKNINLANYYELHAQTPDVVLGLLEGELTVLGRDKDIKELKTDFRLAQEGRIQADFFEPIIRSFPENVTQRKDLEIVLREGGKVPVETAHIEINKWEGKSLSGVVYLKSRKLNIDLTKPIDINLDEDISVVIRKWQEFSWILNYIYKVIMESLSAAIKEYYQN